jgi:hypothetical protein
MLLKRDFLHHVGFRERYGLRENKEFTPKSASKDKTPGLIAGARIEMAGTSPAAMTRELA